MTEYVPHRPEGERYKYVSSLYPYPLMPFIDLTQTIIKRFQEWGATVKSDWGSHITLLTLDLKKGETTFTNDFNLHTDVMNAPSKLKHENKLYLRTLCVSSDTASFVDLTKQVDMMDTLDQHKSPENARVFNPDLLPEALEAGGSIVTPECWDIIVFDGATPHLPKGATIANRRILMSGWIEMELPDDWKKRVQNNDGPQWKP